MAKRTPVKAIRAKCLECCCGNVAEVRTCDLEECPLHEYRMGHRPKENTVDDKSIDESISE